MNIPYHFFTASLDNPKLLNIQENKKWRSYSAQEFLDRVKNASIGLKSFTKKQKLGLQKGSLIALISPSNPTWFIFDQIIMSNQMISVPMFVNVSNHNLSYQIQETKMSCFFIHGEDALKTIASRLKKIKKVFYHNIPKAKIPRAYKNKFISLEDLITEGKKVLNIKDTFLADVKKIKSDQVATIIYTSGSTGEPKGVMLTHDNLLFQMSAIAKIFPLIAHEDYSISCLPLAHIFERTIASFYISQNLAVYFSPNLAQLGNNIREIKPTMMTVVPRILIKVYEKITLSPENLKGIKKKLAQLAIAYAQNHNPEEPHSWTHAIYNKLIYKKFRQSLGDNFKVLVCGGASLSPVVLQFFTNIGINLAEGYGLTETSPVISSNQLNYKKLFTVGPILEGVKVKISANNEILVKGRGVMKGYYKKPKLTKEVFTKDKWFKTGDLGKIDKENNIIISGRIKDLYKLSNGKYITPIPIEQKLELNSWVENALVIADGKKYVSVLLFMNMEKEDESKNNNNFEKSIKSDIAKINKELHSWEKIIKYKCLWQKLSIEEGDMTPKLNIRRNFLLEKFNKTIDKFYE